MKRRKLESGFPIAVAAAVTLVAGMWSGQPDALGAKQKDAAGQL